MSIDADIVVTFTDWATLPFLLLMAKIDLLRWQLHAASLMSAS